MVRLSRWCIAHRRWVIVGWVAFAVAHHRHRRGGGSPVRHRLQPPGHRGPARRRPARQGVQGPERGRRHDRLPQRHGHDRRPGGAQRDRRRCWPRWQPDAARGQRDQPLQPRRARSRSPRTAPPRSPRSTTTSAPTCCPNNDRAAGARRRSTASTSRAQARRGRPGHRAGRGLQHRPGHDGRRDRGAGHPAAHLRLAERRRDAADHRRARPGHRPRARRARHPCHRACPTSRRSWR